VKEVYDGLLFTTHSAAVNLAYPLVSRIREELDRSDRKFVFLCGHDCNLASIGAALRFQFPETEQALELHTPIGSKLVFEKWNDGSEDYVAVNLVYQSVYQLQGRTLLSTDVPPMVLPVTIEGLTANADGLYRLADLDARMAETMAEYDAIEDAPTTVRAVSLPISPSATIYNLQGQRLDTPQRGVNIVGEAKSIVK
jgi:glucose-1-phosphatase